MYNKKSYNSDTWKQLNIVIILKFEQYGFIIENRNDPKFSDRQAWANSADPDQTARSSSTLSAISSVSFGRITLR